MQEKKIDNRILSMQKESPTRRLQVNVHYLKDCHHSYVAKQTSLILNFYPMLLPHNHKV